MDVFIQYSELVWSATVLARFGQRLTCIAAFSTVVEYSMHGAYSMQVVSDRRGKTAQAV